MALMIELPPEMELRLDQEAARRGQNPGEFARTVLEEKLASLSLEPEQEKGGLIADLPRATPEELHALLRAQGAKPVERFEELLGDFWPKDESVDDFLAARRQWQREGATSFPWSQPEKIGKGKAGK